MSESRKAPRPKGPRKPGATGGAGRSKTSGQGGGARGRSERSARGGEDDWRSTPSRDGGKAPRKPAGKPGQGGGKGPRRDDERSARGERGGRGPGADRKPRSDKAGRPERSEKKEPRAPKQAPRVDDFDFGPDFDPGFADGASPAAFPAPARAAKGYAPRKDSVKPGQKPAPAAKAPKQAAPDDGPEALEEGKSVTAGRNPVRELLESNPKRVDAVYVRKGLREARVQEIVALADENRIKVQFVDDVVLRRLYNGTHQGVAAVTAAVEYADLDSLIMSVADAPLPVLLALDQVQDPGNLGAMARTAWALGAAGIIVPRHGGAYIGAGAMRASAGALHHLPVARVTNMSQALDACAEAGLSILCADAGGEDLYEAKVRLPAVLVMGGEEKGVRAGVGKHCDMRLAIPLKRDFDSLNVAQAAAICLARLGRP